MMDIETSVTKNLGVTRTWLLQSLLAHLSSIHEGTVGRDAACHQLRDVAIVLGREILSQYQALHHQAFPLPSDDFIALLTTIGQDLDIPLAVTCIDGHGFTIVKSRCPWEEMREETMSLCHLMSCLYGTIAAANFGYARVSIDRPALPTADAPCRFHLFLHPPDTQEDSTVVEFTRDDLAFREEPAPISPVSLPDIIRKYHRDLQIVHNNYAALYHRQVELTKRLELALEVERAAAKQLRLFNNLKQDFLSNVSHELRTPITAVQGYLSLVHQQMLGTLTPEQDEAINIALRNVERLNSLVNDLLDFSSLSRGQFLLESEPVCIDDVLTQAKERVEEEAKEKEISLRLDAPHALGTVMGDQEKLVQVVAHLLENAIKFSGSGQGVVLAAGREAHEVVIEVRDQGIGMTSEQLEHIFTPFVQGESGLSRRYGGLGMGLSLINNLVSLHGGRIDVISEPGHGTTMRVFLPRLTDERRSTTHA